MIIKSLDPIISFVCEIVENVPNKSQNLNDMFMIQLFSLYVWQIKIINQLCKYRCLANWEAVIDKIWFICGLVNIFIE